MHLGLSLFNAEFCGNPARYPGAFAHHPMRRHAPSWVCFFDDALWKTYQKNVVELAKLGGEVGGVLDGIFLDPEAYGSECYLCFCDNCVGKFNRWSGESMPPGLVKPDAWLHAQARDVGEVHGRMARPGSPPARARAARTPSTR